jgi:cyanophycin synthetase
MTMPISLAKGASSLQSAPHVRWWQRHTHELGLLPVIAVAGGRGKSTVVRMLDDMLTRSHLRTATWTNLGVEIRGKRQRGEISGWSSALGHLAESTIDVAIQELHWSTINAVGLPVSAYPVVAITNSQGSLDAPLDTSVAEAARRGAHRAANAVHSEGTLIVNGDDPAAVEAAVAASATVTLTSLSRESPNLRYHLSAGGSAIWMEHDALVCGDNADVNRLCSGADVACSLDGTVQFQLSNALTAAAIASTIGIDADTIAASLRAFTASPDMLPGSFNTFEVNGYRVHVDGASPSWHLRSLLRAVNPGNRHRQLTVLGNLEGLPVNDIREVGRLLGRHKGAIILHSNKDPVLLDSLRRGIASNDYPPIVIHLPTERRALNRALKTARTDDVVLILCDADPGPSLRALRRIEDQA